MLAVLSPAKSLDFAPAPADIPHTVPEFFADALLLAEGLKRLSPADLRTLLGVSDRLADLNYARFQVFGQPVRDQTAKPAVFAFSGDTYIGLNVPALGRDDVLWAQDHMRILSGLYGVLRPLDLIEPYRLEMGVRFATDRGSTLYAFWSGKVSSAIRAAVAAHLVPAVIILASEEYAKVLRDGGPGIRTIVPVFQEESAQGSKTVGLMAKRARGMMARFMITNRLETPEQLKTFREGGYAFCPERSDQDTWVFARPKP